MSVSKKWSRKKKVEQKCYRDAHISMGLIVVRAKKCTLLTNCFEAIRNVALSL